MVTKWEWDMFYIFILLFIVECVILLHTVVVCLEKHDFILLIFEFVFNYLYLYFLTQ
jgi:hypothetical protein